MNSSDTLLKKYLSICCFIFIVILGIAGCSMQDSNYIPVNLKGLNVYLFDEKKAPNADKFAGYIECSYLSREDGLSKARALAYQEAKRLGFDVSNGRYYIICTATADSSCVTKVR